MPIGKYLTSLTTDAQLYKLAIELGLKLEPIVFKDELRKLKIPEKGNHNYIINLGTTETGGTHWVALFIGQIGKSKYAYFFNSFSSLFGAVPLEITEFIKRSNAMIYAENLKPIQDPKRGYCGEYCLDFLIHMNKKGLFFDNYNEFLKDYKSTKSLIREYLAKHPIAHL